MTRLAALRAGLWPRPRSAYNALLSQWRPVPVQRATVEAVLARFGLGAPAAGLRRPLTPVGRSRNVLLESAGRRLVLKQYKATMRPEGIQYEHAVLRRLAAVGFPAPQLVADRAGRTLVTHEERHYALFECLTGYNAGDYWLSGRRERQLVEQAGAALAHYHQAVAGFQPDGHKADGLTPAGLWWWQDGAWFRERWDHGAAALAAGRFTAAEAHFWRAALPRLRELSATLVARLAGQAEALRLAVIHGDYGPYNLLIDGDGLVAVLDFECVHWNLRVTDLIMALTRFAGTATGLAVDKAAAFLRAYAGANPLEPGERALFADLFALWQLRRLAHYLTETAADALPTARRTLAWLEALPPHPELVHALT